MDKIKNQLAGVAALLGVIAAIGGGFVKYGEIVTKLDALENKEQTVVDTVGIETSLAVLEEKVTALESKKPPKPVDISGIDTRSRINEKSIKLLELKIEEIKAAQNPLGG